MLQYNDLPHLILYFVLILGSPRITEIEESRKPGKQNFRVNIINKTSQIEYIHIIKCTYIYIQILTPILTVSR